MSTTPTVEMSTTPTVEMLATPQSPAEAIPIVHPVRTLVEPTSATQEANTPPLEPILSREGCDSLYQAKSYISSLDHNVTSQLPESSFSGTAAASTDVNPIAASSGENKSDEVSGSNETKEKRSKKDVDDHYQNKEIKEGKRYDDGDDGTGGHSSGGGSNINNRNVNNSGSRHSKSSSQTSTPTEGGSSSQSGKNVTLAGTSKSDSNKSRYPHVVARPHHLPTHKTPKAPHNKNRSFATTGSSFKKSSDKGSTKKEIKSAYVPTAFENALLGLSFKPSVANKVLLQEKDVKSFLQNKESTKELIIHDKKKSSSSSSCSSSKRTESRASSKSGHYKSTSSRHEYDRKDKKKSYDSSERKSHSLSERKHHDKEKLSKENSEKGIRPKSSSETRIYKNELNSVKSVEKASRNQKEYSSSKKESHASLEFKHDNGKIDKIVKYSSSKEESKSVKISANCSKEIDRCIDQSKMSGSHGKHIEKRRVNESNQAKEIRFNTDLINSQSRVASSDSSDCSTNIKVAAANKKRRDVCDDHNEVHGCKKMKTDNTLVSEKQKKSKINIVPTKIDNESSNDTGSSGSTSDSSSGSCSDSSNDSSTDCAGKSSMVSIVAHSKAKSNSKISKLLSSKTANLLYSTDSSEDEDFSLETVLQSRKKVNNLVCKVAKPSLPDNKLINPDAYKVSDDDYTPPWAETNTKDDIATIKSDSGHTIVSKLETRIRSIPVVELMEHTPCVENVQNKFVSSDDVVNASISHIASTTSVKKLVPSDSDSSDSAFEVLKKANQTAPNKCLKSIAKRNRLSTSVSLRKRVTGSVMQKNISKVPAKEGHKTVSPKKGNFSRVLNKMKVTSEGVVIKGEGGKEILLSYEGTTLGLLESDEDPIPFEGFSTTTSDSENYAVQHKRDRSSPKVVLEDMYDFVGFTEQSYKPALSLLLEEREQTHKPEPVEEDLSLVVTGEMFNKQLPIKVFLDAMVKLGATVTGFHAFLTRSPRRKRSTRLATSEHARHFTGTNALNTSLTLPSESLSNALPSEDITSGANIFASNESTDNLTSNSNILSSAKRRITPDTSDSEQPVTRSKRSCNIIKKLSQYSQNTNDDELILLTPETDQHSGECKVIKLRVKLALLCFLLLNSIVQCYLTESCIRF